MSSATDEQLGYDLSVTRVLDRNHQPQYDIRVDSPLGSRVFRTKSVLAEYAVDRVVGRATRVWEVYEGDGGDDSPTFALKDVWVEKSHPREGTMYEALTKDATPEEREYVLTCVCHGDVQLASGDLDTTLGARRGSPPSKWFSAVYGLRRSLSSSTTTETPKGGIPRPPKPTVEPRAFTDRVHYRLVFKEVGVPLFQLRNLGDIWRAVCDANEGWCPLSSLIDQYFGHLNSSTALIVMQKRGYIHCDISPGNILFWNNKGMLSDLEFSTRYNPEAKISEPLKVRSCVDFYSITNFFW